MEMIFMRKAFLFVFLVLTVLYGAITLRTTFQEAPPKYMKDHTGIAFDILVDLKSILRDKGVKIVWDGRYRSMKEITSMLDSCKIDFFVGMAKTEERLSKFVFSSYPIYSLKYIIVFRKDYNVKNPVVLTIAGTRSEEWLKKWMPVNYTLVSVSSVDNAIRSLLNKQADGIFYNSLSLGYYVNNHSELLKVFSSRSERYYHFIAFSRCVSKGIVDEFDNALRGLITSGRIEEVIEKYGLENFVKPPNFITLVNIDWPPYEFMENGEWKGIDAEVVKRVFEKMGYKVSIHKLNWARILHYIERGIIDGTFSLTTTEDRGEYMYFSSEPLSMGIDGFLYLKDRVSVGDIKSGKPLVCGYVSGYAYEDFLKDTTFKLVNVADDESGVKLLLNGRIDLFAVNKLVGFYYVRKFDALGRVGFFPAMGFVYYYLALSKIDEYHKLIVDEFSKELREFKKTSEYRNILRKYGVDYEEMWRR
jgi:polar amino acid transport system substrate-binding protein